MMEIHLPKIKVKIALNKTWKLEHFSLCFVVGIASFFIFKLLD